MSGFHLLVACHRRALIPLSLAVACGMPTLPGTAASDDTYLAHPDLFEFHLDGHIDGAGPRLLGAYTAHGHPVTLSMEAGALIGRPLDAPRVVLRGQALTDLALHIHRATEEDEPAREWTIFVRSELPWTRLSDEYGYRATYRLTVAPGPPDEAALAPQRYLCSGRPQAVLVTGERYDADTWNIRPGSSGSDLHRWLTIGCHGSPLWTMVLAGYDPARPAHDPYATTPAERQATLRMLRADYCGTGRSFGSGPAIGARNRSGWVSFSVPDEHPGLSSQLEAGWTGQGAVCLTRPRHSDVWSRDAIEAVCGRPIPICTQTELDLADWISRTL